jgi:multidrug efflux pump subunit AcrA (membrane-fusion protein)
MILPIWKYITLEVFAGHRKDIFMRHIPRRIIPVFILVLAVIGVGGYYLLRGNPASARTVVSGTIETTEVHLGTQFGGKVDSVNVKEGDSVQEGQVLVEVHMSTGSEEQIRATINGVVLERSIEPGEIASPSSTLLTIASLTDLTLTVYVPEDRYGQITLGQTYPITVDSFPGRTFEGTVSHIADQAEFTPRNVQTVEGRKSTVFAIRLSISNPDMALKPGMPADVTLNQ